MNAEDILKYGHTFLMGCLDGIPMDDWTTSGVCGWWSVKDIIAHLTSYELTLVDILGNLVDGRPTPTLNQFRKKDFNDLQVAQRQASTPVQVLAEYQDAHQKVQKLIAQIPPDTRRQNGVLDWYGEEYDLEDFLVYSFYGHKREHGAQIAVFKDTLK